MMTNPYIKQLILITFAVVVFGTLVEIFLHPIGRVYNNFVLDSSDPYKTCSQLPAVADAQTIVKNNEAELNKLKEFDNGIYWWVDSSKCNGQKGELLIFYGSHQSRLEIEKVIKHNNFHGVPTILSNI